VAGGHRLRLEQDMCRHFFRIDEVSQWIEEGKAERARGLMAALRTSMAGREYDYVGFQVSGAIFRSAAREKNVPALLDELCSAIRASGARPLLFEHWSTDAARMRAYCLEAARRHGGRVVLCGSAAEEVLSEGGLRYAPRDGMAGPLGGYLAACCLYAALTGESPEGLASPPEVPFGTRVRLGPGKDDALTFSAGDVRRMQRGAWEVQRKYEGLLEEGER
jgi:hypothetical protein